MSGPCERSRILYIVPGTGKYAGIERVVDEIATELARTHSSLLDVDVLFLSTFANYEVGDRPYRKIERIPRGRADLVRCVREVVGAAPYALVVVPQIEATVVFWSACLGLGRKFVLHLHGNPSRERSHTKATLLFAAMKHVVLSRLAAVFGTSPRQLAGFRTSFPSGVPQFWVPNPVRSFAVPAEPRGPSGTVTFVSVARYDRQKGQDLLIGAFHALHRVHDNARLRLVGFGADEQMLREDIAERGLSEAVTLEHFPDSPEVPLSSSDVYVCSSRWEGWSLAICEALRFGLPVVATDCDYGPSDILTDPRLGRLVALPESPEHTHELVAAMSHYCEHLEQERAHAAFRRAYVDRFSAQEVARVHAAAILKSAHGRPERKVPAVCYPRLE